MVRPLSLQRKTNRVNERRWAENSGHAKEPSSLQAGAHTLGRDYLLVPLPPHHSRANGSMKLELRRGRAHSHVEDNVVHRVKSRQLLFGASCPCNKVPLAQVGLWELERKGEHKRVGPTAGSMQCLCHNSKT